MKGWRWAFMEQQAFSCQHHIAVSWRSCSDAENTKRYTEALCATCRHIYLLVSICVLTLSELVSHVRARVQEKKSPDLSVWVAERTTLVVGLTRVKPGLFETGLTPGLSYVLCVWELLTFRPFPHVRCAEAPKAAGWPAKPETISLRLQMEELSFALKFLMWKSFQLLLMNHLLHRVNVSIQ